MLLLFIFLSYVCGESSSCERSCPPNWHAEGQYCYKPSENKMGYMQARSSCLALGGKLLHMSHKEHFRTIKKVITHLAKEGHVVMADDFWTTYRIASPRKSTVPPILLKGKAISGPAWLHDTDLESTVYLPGVYRHIRSGRNRIRKTAKVLVVFSFDGLGLSNGRTPHKALCQINTINTLLPDDSECWEPANQCFEEVEYVGTQSVSSRGYTCENWDDESYQRHHYMLPSNERNYCRNPDDSTKGPWCYIQSDDPEDRWDWCDIQRCLRNNDDLSEGQSICGENLRVEQTDTAKIFNGKATLKGQAPFMARLRHRGEQNYVGLRTDHVCGAALISSCWALTAAHCVPPKGTVLAETFLEVGNRFSHDKAGNAKYVESVCDPYSEDYHEDVCDDMYSHQTLKINKIIIHPEYRNTNSFPHHDIALIQLHATGENKLCAITTKAVQYACLNSDFQAGAVCEVSGWGNTGVTRGKYTLPDQLQSANVTMITTEQCRRKYVRSHFYDELCAFDSKSDALEFDSGGPLACFDEVGRAYLTGLISYGSTVGLSNIPGIYTNVAAHDQWIRSVTMNTEFPDYNPEHVCMDVSCF